MHTLFTVRIMGVTKKSNLDINNTFPNIKCKQNGIFILGHFPLVTFSKQMSVYISQLSLFVHLKTRATAVEITSLKSLFRLVSF